MAVLLAGPAGRGAGRHREPAVRLGHGGGRGRQPRDRRGRRVDLHRRRRGVDEPRAVGGAEAREGLPAHRPADGLHHAGMAAGQPRDAVRSGRCSLGEGAELLAREYDISREAQDEFAVESHRRAAAAWERGAYDDETVDVEGVELERDEPIRPDTLGREAGQAQARLPRRRQRDRRQLLAAERRRGRAAAGRRGGRGGDRPRPAGPHRLPRAARGGPAALRHRTGGGGQPGAGAGRDRLGRHRGGRAQRGVRRPGAGLRVGVGRGRPRAPERERRRRRAGPPDRVLGRSHPGHAELGAARRGGMGLGALCIGVGQGIAMVLEAA